MTRRKALGLLLASLIGVYVVGGLVGVSATRSRLIGETDDRLRDTVEAINAPSVELPFWLEEFAAERENERAILLIGPDGTIDFDRPPGPAVDQLGRPDVSVEEIMARPGEVFTVEGIDADHGFRVIVEQLEDGGFLVIAEPLRDVRQTLRTLTNVLMATLFGVLTLLGLMLWWLARLTLAPYDEIIATADAIVAGDLDRRVRSQQPDPEVQRLVGSINRMLDQNQEALAARIEAEARVTRFAAEASHELRTPLATIIGYSEVYLSGASTDRQAVEKQMTRINGEATRLGRLVESMLTITRLDNEVAFETAAVDLVEVARAAISDAALGSVDPEDATRLALAEPSVGPVVVDGDRDSLYRVFANLLANAQVHAPGADVAVSVEAAGGHAIVSLSDNGPGMAPHVADSAFDRFYRGSPTSDSGRRTTGLGLSIAASIIKAHGGSIDLFTALGNGATFTIRLPLVASQTLPEFSQVSPSRS